MSLNSLQMASHLKQSEAELNELLAEYWKIRHQTGELKVETLCLTDRFCTRCIHGDAGKQIKYASLA